MSPVSQILRTHIVESYWCIFSVWAPTMHIEKEINLPNGVCSKQWQCQYHSMQEIVAMPRYWVSSKWWKKTEIVQQYWCINSCLPLLLDSQCLPSLVVQISRFLLCYNRSSLRQWKTERKQPHIAQAVGYSSQLIHLLQPALKEGSEIQ